VTGTQYLLMVHGDSTQVASFLCDLDAAIDEIFQKYPDIAVMSDSKAYEPATPRESDNG
jgi:hypothetical protein